MAEAGKATVSTRARKRMPASDTSTGIAMRSSTTFWKSSTTDRAIQVKASASSGNSRPSTMTRPNQMDSAVCRRPANQATAQAAARQASSTVTSTHMPG